MSELTGLPSLTDMDQWVDTEKEDEGLDVRFYANPITGDDHVEIATPGDKSTVHDTTANDWYKQRFRRQWENYQARLDNYAGQIRLETVSWIDPGMLKEILRFGIHTVEQLSQLSDSNISQTQMRGLSSFREKAIKHLADRHKSAEYDELKEKHDDLMKRLEALEQAPQKRGPGRPRKAV